MEFSESYPHNDETKAAVECCSYNVVTYGLNYLIPCWGELAGKADYNDGSIIYEYLNDLDGRRLIDQILAVLPAQNRAEIFSVVESYDKQFVEKTFEVRDCLWGNEAELKHGYSREKNFYYYRAPQFIINNEPDIQKL
jgi:hypothetical protein